MKITRQNINESYRTTVDWLDDFSRKMEKNADFLSNVKNIFRDRKNKFSSVDEKMDDMKNRVGFNLIKNNSNDFPEKKAVASESEEGCGCTDSHCGQKKDTGAACSSCTKNSDIKSMEEILNYIGDYAKDKPHVSVAIVFSHCRDHPSLGFREMEGKIDHNKLKNFISDQLGIHKTDNNAVEYVSDEGIRDEAADIPEFMSHSIPSN